MRKSTMIWITMMAFIFFASCRHPETYEFLKTTEKIASISIVEISFNENCELEQTEIKKINDINAFLDDFNQVSCYVYYGDPLGVTPEGVSDTVVKITYENDDYELINWSGQSEYTDDKKFQYYAGFSVFDEKQFETLIEKYSVD